MNCTMQGVLDKKRHWGTHSKDTRNVRGNSQVRHGVTNRKTHRGPRDECTGNVGESSPGPEGGGGGGRTELHMDDRQNNV